MDLISISRNVAGDNYIIRYSLYRDPVVPHLRYGDVLDTVM